MSWLEKTIHHSTDDIFRRGAISKEYSSMAFWQLAMLKGPKRSFVVVLVLGMVETWVKNAPNGTKNARVQNLIQIE